MNTSHTAPPPAEPHVFGASLRRSSSDRILLGLCGGIAAATGTNATAVRLATVALGVLLLPLVALAYLVSAAILPRDDGAALIGPGRRDRRDVTVAVIATFIAAPLVLGTAAATGFFPGPGAWPLLLVAAGVALGVALYRPRPATTTTPVAPFETPAMPGTPPMTPPAQHSSEPAAPTMAAASRDNQAVASTGEDPTPAAPTDAPTLVKQSAVGATPPTFVKPGVEIPGGVPGGVPGEHAEPPVGEPGPAQPEARRGLTLPILGLMVLIPGIFATLYAVGAVDGDWSTWAVMLSLQAITAAAGAVAIALLRPSYLGAGVLVILAAVLGTASIGVSQVGPLLDEGVGERTYRPTSVSELRSPYTLGLGALDLDLRALELRNGSRTRIQADIGYGEMRIAVPEGVRVTASEDSPITGITTSARNNGAAPSESASAPTIELDLSARGADISLLSGEGRDLAALDVLAQESAGFWSSGDRSDGSPFDRDAAPLQIERRQP